MTIGQISIDKKEKVSVPPPLPLLFKTKTIDFITGTGTYLINYKQINYSLNFQVTGAAAAGKMTVKVKQLSELLAKLSVSIPRYSCLSCWLSYK